MNRFTLLVAAATATLASGAANAEAGKWTGRILGGVGFAVGGNVHNGATASIPNLGPLIPGLAGLPGTLAVGSRSQQSVYGESWGAGIEIGHFLSDRSEVFGSVRYDSTGAGFYPVGTLAVPARNASHMVFGSFGAQENWSTELGYRHYLKTAGTFRPYLAGRAGIAFSNRVNATFTAPTANVTLSDVPFSRPSTLFTGGLDAGAAFALGRGISLIAETGVRYTSGPRGAEQALGTLGLGDINNAGDRLEIPVRIGLGFAF